MSLSATGNLTIIFSRPLILPPIEVRNVTNHTERELSAKRRAISIKEVLNITVESDYYTPDDEKIIVKNYFATRISEKSLDIQLDFLYPQALTKSAIYPDELRIDFKHGEIFMDQLHF